MNKYRRFESEYYYTNPSTNERHLFPSLSDPSTLHLSVIIPAKDEEERIPSMLDECIPYLQGRTEKNNDFTWEIIIVDDGSNDKTTEIGLKYSNKLTTERVRVLTLVENRGKGGAVRLGMVSARGRYLLFVDADGATKFDDFSKLEAEMLDLTNRDEPQQTKAIVLGSRAHLEKDSISKRSLFRTILMFGFHFLVWLFCVKTIKDTQCGFKLFSRDAASVLFGNLHIEGWAFDVELLFLAEKMDIPIKEVQVNWTEIEGSKIVPGFTSIQMGKDLFLIWFRYFFGIWQLDLQTKIE